MEWGLKALSYGLIVLLLLGIFLTFKHRQDVKHWGRRLFLLWSFGLFLCIVVAYRDAYYLSVMALTDDSVTPGVFAADSFQSTVCMILGGINMLTVLSALVIRKQSYMKCMFVILAIIIIAKICIIEFSMI
ncbi:MAG TPA: hypothetical protein DHV05_06015 [Acholeplasmataceae bacterium]|nr:hypothetical protein [Acholeplasmataceae bacterium]